MSSVAPSCDTASPAPGDDFFIGWEPPPQSYARFLRLVAAVLLLVAICAAALVAFPQANPGTGQWDSEDITSLDGIVYAGPYAMLHVPGRPPRTFLLVEEGKFGALDRVEKVAEGFPQGRPVRVRGTILHRDDRWMFELAEGGDGMRPLTETEQRALPSLSLPARDVLAENITLHGEIIDPKCYLGAMKPGGGKTHKGCASLCLGGGIPPMLVTRDTEQRETFYLLTTMDGKLAGELPLPFVGDLVAISGRLERQGDLLVLAVGDVQRR